MAFYTGNLLDAALGPGAGTGMGEGIVRPAPMQPSAPQADPMAYYFQLGQQLLQKQQAMQQQLQPQQPATLSGGGPDTSFDLGSTGLLTAGFDPTWLTQRLDAASANGAAIGGIGSNPGQGPVTRGAGGKSGDGLPAGGTGAGWNTPTTQGSPAGAARLFSL